MSRSQDWWDRWFLGMSQYVSTASKDPSTKVGAVLVDDKRRVISVGYNGFPRGVEDTTERLENREIKYKMVSHAERNAVLFAKTDLEGSTLYTWPFMSCSTCAGAMIQAGVKRCVAPKVDNPRWIEECALARIMFAEAGVELCELDDI